MKRFLLNLPIRHKLMALTVGISGIALLIACAAFAFNEQGAFRRTMARDFAILADMFDDNVAAGLAFNDAMSIEQTLQTLGANPRIAAACVYNREGGVVASYRRTGTAFDFPSSQPTGQNFGAERLDTFQAVTLAGETIGVVYISTDLSELRERAWRYAVIVGVLLVGCSLVALLLVSRLQRIVSQPLVDLAQTVATVTTGKNYTVRARKHSDDELGRLIDGFNEMLAQIQTRDSALQAAHDNLEQHVAERTARLAEASSLLEALLVNSPDFIYFKDRASRMVRFSHALLVRYKFADADALCGKTDFDLFSAEVAQSFYDDEQKIMRTGQPSLDRLTQENHLDGRVTWALTTKLPWRDGNGAIVGTFGISKDVTAMKQAEAKLAETHRQLLATSRQAGMAEIATGVLHNVGNVLNSVNVSATVVLDRVRNTKAAGIAKLAALLGQHTADLGEFLVNDPRGRMIPGYLGTLGESLATERQAILAELDHLRKNIEHIKEIVAMQQSYARATGVTEMLAVPDLIEEALRLNADSLARHDIEFVRDFQPTPAIATDKHKVMQILVNLMRNAKHACDESPGITKRIVVRTSADEHTVRIAVIDTGVGIPAENLNRIFSHGFTTRKHGHGFGLHSGALAAKELGGSLSVQSDGPGCGATFILELPLNPAPSPASPP